MAVNPQGEGSATTIIMIISISLNVEIISEVNTLPFVIQWSKEDKVVSVIARKNFFIKR